MRHATRTARGSWSRCRDADLDRVHDPLMSPLVWDLGHIAAFEDLWLCQPRRRARPAAARPRRASTTRSRPRARSAATSPTCAATTRSTTWTRCASARSRCSTADLAPDRPTSGQLVVAARAPAQRDDAPDAAARRAGRVSPPRARATASGVARDGHAWPCPAGRSRWATAATASPTTTSARATRVELDAFEIDRAPVTNGAYRRVRGGRRLPPARAVDARQGWEHGAARAGERPLYWTADGGERRFDRELRARPGAARDARVLVRGRRLRALARRAAAHRGRVGEGGCRRGGPPPWGDERPPSANLDQLAFGPPPALPAARPWARWLWATAGSGPRASSTATRASSPSPTREYSEVFFGGGYQVLRGGSWATRPGVARDTFRNWDLPAAAPDLRRLPLRGGGMTRHAEHDHASTASATVLDTLADDVRDGLRPPAEGAAAQVLLRRARLGAVRPHHRAARVLPHALRAGDPQPPRARHRGEHAAPRSWSSSARGRPRRRARCSTRWPARGRCDRYVPFDVDESVVQACADELAELYPGLEVHGVVGRLRAATSTTCPPATAGCSPSSAARSATSTRASARRSCARSRALMGPTTGSLLGTDLVKDRAMLEAAYNDSAGVTAEFNRNVLRVINRELDADFDPDAFEHVAFFDEANSWIEMRLRAQRRRRRVAHRRRRPGRALRRRRGDPHGDQREVHARAPSTRELAPAGLRLEDFLTDDGGLLRAAVASRGARRRGASRYLPRRWS